MCRRIIPLVLCLSLLAATQAGCWSSKEIEDLALYTGLALDTGKLTKAEQELEAQGITYMKRDTVTATVQIVPVKTPVMDNQQGRPRPTPYLNLSGTGDSILEIFRQFSVRNERPVVGHHLKVIVVSSELLKQHTMEQLMNFVLHDNDIRPSTIVFISQGRAEETFVSKRTDEIPSFHLRDMVRGQKRTSKVLDPVIISELDALMHSKRSYALQNLVTAGGETEFSGAAVVKGDSGHWIGNLSQEDTECLTWLTNKGMSGAIKAYDRDDDPMTYEIKDMKSKIKARIDGDDISFDVSIQTEGRLIETWSSTSDSDSAEYTEKVGRIFEAKLEKMMGNMIEKLQKEYKADVAGFGEALSIQYPRVWKKVQDHWDDTFSRSKINIKYDLKITDYGSFTE